MREDEEMRKMRHDVEHGKEDHITSLLQNVKEQKRISLMQCSQSRLCSRSPVALFLCKIVVVSVFVILVYRSVCCAMAFYRIATLILISCFIVILVMY
jgi:hypothetical protein